MIRKTYLRRVLLVSLVAAGLALAPAEARVAAPAQRPGSDASPWIRRGNPFNPVWHWLTNLWGKEGSSMDPLGRH